MSEAAGRSFSREFAKDGGMGDGKVRVQDPHNLHCQKVYHVSIRKWKGNTEKVREMRSRFHFTEPVRRQIGS